MLKVCILSVLLSAWLLSSSLHAYDVITTNPCEGHANGARVANPQNCSKFFVCLDEFEAVSSSCPSGLHFNNELSECDFPSKAGCEIQIIGGGTCDCNNCCSICNCNNGGTTGVPTTTPGGCDTPGTGPTAAPTPSPTPTPSPEPSPTPTPSPEPSPTPTPSPEPSPTPTPSPGPSPTPTPSPGPSPTPTPSPGPSPSPTPTPSPGPSSNPTPSPGPSPSPTPTPSPGPSPSPTPTPTPSPGPSPNPTPSPEPSPTSTPSPGPSPTPTPSPEPSPSPTPTKLPYDPTTAPPPGIPNCHNNITVCINKPDNEIVYPVGTCREYYICLGGCAQVITCPNNLLYNKKTKQCDYPHNVDCPYKPIPPPVGPTAGPSGIACDGPGKCANKPDGTKFVSSSPNKYIECQCECELERSCPSDLFFNPILQVCDWTDPSGEFENFVCINNSPICESQKDGSVIPIEGVCNQFYKCYLGCAVQQICPDNLVYNQNKQYCDFPQNYKCPWTNNPPTGPHAGPSGIACVDGGRCANKSDGTFFNSTNSCGKYVICQCGCEVEMNCPQGLSWDTSKKTCNYSNLVQCNL